MASRSGARSESISGFIPEIERLVAKVMDERKIPGLAIAVVKNGEVTFLGGLTCRSSPPIAQFAGAGVDLRA